MILALMVNHEPKNTRFYLYSAAEVHMCYTRSLFSIYKEKSSPLVCTTDHTEFNILEKSIVTLNVLVDGKSKVLNFCNILYTPELKYNLFSIGTIEKVGYLILDKKGKITIFDNQDNIAFKATRIRTSYLVNVFASEKTLVLAFLHSVLHNHMLQT